MRRANITALAIAGIILLSLFLAINYQPAYATPSNFFGVPIGTVVLFGAHLEHELAGLGLVLGMSVSVLALDPSKLGLSRRIVPHLLVLGIGAVLFFSDLQGFVTPITTGGLISLAIGLIYAGLVHLLVVGAGWLK